MGLKVISPQQKNKPNRANDSQDSMFYINSELMSKVYELYKEYIANFGPNLNSCQVLLYLYKQFFNIRNENYRAEYSEYITKILTNDVVLKYI